MDEKRFNELMGLAMPSGVKVADRNSLDVLLNFLEGMRFVLGNDDPDIKSGERAEVVEQQLDLMANKIETFRTHNNLRLITYWRADRKEGACSLSELMSNQMMSELLNDLGLPTYDRSCLYIPIPPDIEECYVPTCFRKSDIPGKEFISYVGTILWIGSFSHKIFSRVYLSRWANLNFDLPLLQEDEHIDFPSMISDDPPFNIPDKGISVIWGHNYMTNRQWIELKTNDDVKKGESAPANLYAGLINLFRDPVVQKIYFGKEIGLAAEPRIG